MLVSCVCITYGRHHLLEEAIESFLRQDYNEEKELIVVNDLVDSNLFFSHPEIKIFNVHERFKSLGSKRNFAIRRTSGSVIFPWDDDDISLPHRISFSLEQIENKHFFKAKRFWRMDRYALRGPHSNIAHAQSAYTRKLYDMVGGYSNMGSGEDQVFENKVNDLGYFNMQDLPDDKLYYIIRWGFYPHLSTFAWGKGEKEFHEAVMKRKCPASYVLSPHWEKDYVEMVHDKLPK